MTKLAKRLKSKSDLPTWFSLDLYDSYVEPEDWLEAITWRVTAETILENTGNKNKAKDVFLSFAVKTTGERLLSKDFRPRWPVMELSAFDAIYLTTTFTSNKAKRLARKVEQLKATKNSDALFGSKAKWISQSQTDSFDSLIQHSKEPYNIADVLHGIPITINPDFDDETLVTAFRVWLAGAREILGAAKARIDTKDLVNWKKYGVLPAFDLVFWAKINNSKYTDTAIANAIWPHVDVDCTERFRKVTKPKMNQILNWPTVRRFWAQLELEEHLDRVIQESGTKSS